MVGADALDDKAWRVIGKRIGFLLGVGRRLLSVLDGDLRFLCQAVCDAELKLFLIGWPPLGLVLLLFIVSGVK